MIRKFTPFIIVAVCLMVIQSFGQASRLIGYNVIRYNNNQWEPYDTARYVYNPGNNAPTSVSYYNDVIIYDTMYRAGWDGTTYVDAQRKDKIYNIMGKCTERIEYQLYPSLALNKKFTFTYDGNNDMTEELGQHWDGSAWVNDYRIQKTYNNNHDALATTTQYWAGTQWGNPYLYVNTYDGNHNMTSQVSTTYNTGTSQFDSTGRSEYFYNVNNKVDSSRSYDWNSGWVLNGHTLNYYGVNNINMGYLTQSVSGGNWVNLFQAFTILNVNNIVIGDSTQQWSTTNNAWVDYSRGHSTLDGNNRSIEYRYQTWNTTNNAWQESLLDSAAYNNYDQYTWFKRISWNTTTQQWFNYNDQDAHYYYEEYTPNHIAKTSADAGLLMLYPVPAKGSMNINLQWNKAEDLMIGVYDMQGRLVSQWSESATKNLIKNIPLNGLSSGTYILKVRGKDATVQEQFVIMD